MKPKPSSNSVTVDWNSQKNYADIKEEERNLKNQQRSRAKARANKNKSIPQAYDSSAELLEALWNAGAFKGLKDVHGRPIVYDTAVDGMFGDVSNQALLNAIKMGYKVDRNKGTIFKPNSTKKAPKAKILKTTDEYYWSLSPNERKRYDIDHRVWDEKTKKWVPAMDTYAHTPEYKAEFDYGPNPKDEAGHFSYTSRLGSLGLVAAGDGTYRLYDKNGNLVDKCALTVNGLLLMLRKHQNTIGNAWDSHGMYGDSMLINGYKYLPKIGGYNKVTHTLLNLAAAAAVLTLLNDIDLQTGDVVGLYSANSDHNDEAWNNGTRNRSNSHEGIVFRPGKERNRTYVIHNIYGDISVDPISKFMVSKSGLLLDWAPTYVMRPNSKPNSSRVEEERSYPLTYRMSKDGKNFYNILTAEGKKKYGLDIHSGKTYALIDNKPVEI